MSIQNQDISTADADAYHHAIVAGENAFISTPSEPLDGQAIVGFIQATEVLGRFSCSNAGTTTPELQIGTRTSHGDINRDETAILSLDGHFAEFGIEDEDTPVNLCDIHLGDDEFGKIHEIERSIVAIGAIGAGKTTFVGNVSGIDNRQTIGLDSQTQEVRREKFTQYYRRPDGTYYGINFTVYDTYGFIGDPQKDIWALDALLSEISDNFHAVIFCITAVRLHQSGDNILRLIARVGGSAIKSRLKFVVTNAPWRLVSANDFLYKTKAKLEEVVGFPIKDEDIVTSDLIDPNQFARDDPQRVTTRHTWIQHQKKFSRWIKNIREAPIRVTRIPWHAKLYALLYVYWTRILLYMAISLCILLFIRLAIDNHHYEIANLRNEELIRSYDTLMTKHTECRTQMEDLLHAAAGTAGAGLGSAGTAIPAAPTTFIGKVSDGTKAFVCGVASNMMNLFRGK